MLFPGVGVVVVEVKGGAVHHDGDHWWQGNSSHQHKIDPVEQARRTNFGQS